MAEHASLPGRRWHRWATVFLALVWLMSWGHSRQAEEFTPTSSSILAPVYGPLAKQIVAEFQLADKQGIGIDLGSGHGGLIIEIKDYQVRIPISETHRDTRYGIWIEFHKPL